VRILLDTNILLRFSNQADREYALIREAVRTLVKRGGRLCFASQNLVEFWNVCTRPAERNGVGLTVLETDERTRELESEFTLLSDTGSVHPEWRRLVVVHSVSGVQVHDARIVAAMLAHGVTQILTLNPRDFQRFTEVTVLHPADVVTA
jgi:predicted nucleic acid-binding protein